MADRRTSCKGVELVTRGEVKKIGDRFTNKNGYTYQKTDKGWEPVLHLLAEQKLGRPLKPEERPIFKDGNRHNLNLDNVEVTLKYSRQSLQAKLVRIEEQIRELQEQAQELRDQIAKE
jgi:hypothetical protein